MKLKFHNTVQARIIGYVEVIGWKIEFCKEGFRVRIENKKNIILWPEKDF
jgi:hypothetical protein